MPNDTPPGWVQTTLGDITWPSRNRAQPAEFPELRYVGLEHIEPQTMRLLEHGHATHARSSSIRFFEGDVLYGKMRPYLNKVWVATFDGLCSAEFLVFRKQEALNSRFLALRLNAEDFVNFANAQISGERPRVDFEKLARFPISLPPIAEQYRIVSKLNISLSGIERAQSAANRAYEKLQPYRDAVLGSAVTGTLTREWRATNEDETNRRKVGTGKDVVLRLLVARRDRWEKAQLAKRQEKGYRTKDDESKSGYKEPAYPESDDLPELPKSWAWASLEAIAEIGSGVAVSQNRLINDPVELPYLRVANVLRGYLDLTEVKTIRIEKDLAPQYLLQAGDILFTEGGDRDKLGRGWIWEGQIPKCIHQNHVFRARLYEPSLIDGRLVSHWANSIGQRFFLAHGTQTTNLASINKNVLRRLPVPIPPVLEQSQIIAEVGRRLASADQLASKLKLQIERAGATREALLKEAFAGRLGTSSPDDEPASFLLDRMRNQRAESEAEWKRANRLRVATKKRVRIMQQQPTTPESLHAAWNRIGQKTDARLLFDEAGLGPEHVVPFYEALRAAPELRAAFERASQEQRKLRKVTKAYDEQEEKPNGRFRLIKLWLEDFKNLKDYTIQFDPSHSLDVVLGWNGTGKSNLFEALVIIFRDLHNWWERNRWPDKPMTGFRLAYEIDEQIVDVNWHPDSMKRPELRSGPVSVEEQGHRQSQRIKREQLQLPRFVFGYYSGPTNRLAEHFLPMKQAHYDRLREAKADDARTLARLLEQRRFFCAETHHAKYVLLAFSYKDDPKVSEFLENRLRILGFESALFIIRKPRWAKSKKAEEFWGATGIMRRVMERLSRYAIAPMVVRQTVSYGYRSSTEDHYYFFLPNLESLYAFAAEYHDARTFFLALESTDFSELIHDVKIQVRVKATNTEQVPITFHQLSEGEQQLLMVLGLMRFTKSHQSFVLLDEPDTHLNPHWSVNYLKDLTWVMSDSVLQSPEQQSSQTLMATHDPLVIASLVKEQVHLLKRDTTTGVCKWEPASVNPRGLGFTGILTSEMFGFRSDLDPETLADLDHRVRLIGKENELTAKEKKELEEIDKRLADAGFSKAFSDPYYSAFVRAWGRRHSELMAGEEFLTKEKRQEIDSIAQEVLKEAVAEVEKGVVA